MYGCHTPGCSALYFICVVLRHCMLLAWGRFGIVLLSDTRLFGIVFDWLRLFGIVWSQSRGCSALYLLVLVTVRHCMLTIWRLFGTVSAPCLRLFGTVWSQLQAGRHCIWVCRVYGCRSWHLCVGVSPQWVCRWHEMQSKMRFYV